MTVVHNKSFLVVLGPGAKWNLVSCRCVCGSVRDFNKYKVAEGHTKSCGCRSNQMRALAKTKHGRRNSRTYNCWANMVARCRDKTDPYYGGRGIRVCSRWATFKEFYADMGECPPGMSVDRYPNRNGNYEPGNCRWASNGEQRRNRDDVLLVSWRGVTKCLTDWVKELGVSRGTLKYRIESWGVEKAMKFSGGKN